MYPCHTSDRIRHTTKNIMAAAYICMHGIWEGMRVCPAAMSKRGQVCTSGDVWPVLGGEWL